MDRENEIRQALRSLIDGITRRNRKEQMKWHKVVYQIGKSALPIIESKLVTFYASNIDGHLRFLYVTGLMQLAHDIDEEQAHRITQRLLRNGGDKMIANRLRAINEFSLEQHTRFTIRGISIFVDKGIITLYPLRRRLKKWFRQIPDQDLKDVDRVYIEGEKPGDYLGQYAPIFYTIKLIWASPFSWYNPLLWLFSWIIWLKREHTFYHEIGHHAHHHTFGQDPDQEREADHYAGTMWAKRHPILYGVIALLMKIVPKDMKEMFTEQR